MERTIGWGLIATGAIARRFAADLSLVEDAELAAVGSRTPESADAFATEFGASRAYDSYEAVVADPAVDVVYVATPHPFHYANVMTCFEAGKNVLCEKPIALNARDAETMVREARKHDVFFMEAMWMRLNPNIRTMQQIVADGKLGDLTSVGVDYGFIPDRTASARLFDPNLGGGAILDIGIYPLTFSWLFLGQPLEMRSVGTLSDRQIDLAVSTSLRYASGATASLQCTFLANTPCHAFVAGTRGHLEVPNPFFAPGGFGLFTRDGLTNYSEPVPGNGYTHEIDEVHACLRAGRRESELVPLDETVALMRMLDEIRAEVGSILPGEAQG